MSDNPSVDDESHRIRSGQPRRVDTPQQTESPRIYQGWIEERGHGDADDVIYLSDSPDPLAERIRDDIDERGHYLSVRYHITDTERTGEELEQSLATIAGIGEAEFRHFYSEVTGYLWTDEEIKVGGHNLLVELRSHVGSFCRLEIAYAHTTGERHG